MANLNKVLFNSLFITLLLPALVLGQSKNDKTVVGKVGKQNITYGEVIKNYSSSGINEEPTLEELQEFLPIYLDYRAKLMSARDQGYYQDSTLLSEHESYVKQAAYAYWLENVIKRQAFDEYKKRADTELKTYHILIALNENAPQSAVDDAISKLNKAKEEIQNGAPLDSVNNVYSSVRNGRSMGGDIPWISAGRTVREFEDQIYSLNIGEISEPFRTQFGYHIVLLQDKRDRTMARQVDHIFIRNTGDSTAYDQIHEAYNKLVKEEPWNRVLREYSQDGASARFDGRIGWVSYQKNYAPDFVEAVMKIDPSVPFSEPVRTNYGYHIFRIDSVETYASESERDRVLMKELKNTPYYKENNEFIATYLRGRFGVDKSESVLNDYEEWVSKNDSLKFSELGDPKSLSNQVIYTFHEQDYQVQDYHAFLKSKFGDRLTDNYQPRWYTQFLNQIVSNELIDLTLDIHPEFKEQSESYLNGLVVYKINEDHVWSAATVDTSRLKEIYENDSSVYRYPKRPHFYLVTSRKDSILKEAMDFVSNGGELDSLESRFERLWVSVDSTTIRTEEPFDRLQEMETASFSEIFEYNNNKAVLWLKEWLPARKMTFDEAFNRVLSDFQPIRENEWLSELRKRYKIKVNQKNLRKAFKRDS